MSAKAKKQLAESAVLNPSIVLDRARGLDEVLVIGRNGKGKVVVSGSHGHAKSRLLLDAAAKTLPAL